MVPIVELHRPPPTFPTNLGSPSTENCNVRLALDLAHPAIVLQRSQCPHPHSRMTPPRASPQKLTKPIFTPFAVAEEDFMGTGGELSQQHYFLPAGHQSQQTLLESGGGFCHFPAGNHFPQMEPHHQGNSHVQQPQQQRAASHGTGGTIHLWHFIRELLDQPKEYGGCVRWVDRKEGIMVEVSRPNVFLSTGTFKIESSHHLARYWGIRKNRMAMNYDKLSRSLRQYYKKGIIQKPEKKQRLVGSWR